MFLLKLRLFWSMFTTFLIGFIILIVLFMALIGGIGSRGGAYKDGAGQTTMDGVMTPEEANALKDLVTGDTLGDRMMSLSGKLTYNSTDGTNCMRTVSIAMSEDDSRYSYLGNGDVVNVDVAVDLAKEHGDYMSFPGFDGLKEGDIIVYGDNDHVAVFSNGQLIQNGASQNTVYAKDDLNWNRTPITGIIRGK